MPAATRAPIFAARDDVRAEPPRGQRRRARRRIRIGLDRIGDQRITKRRQRRLQTRPGLRLHSRRRIDVDRRADRLGDRGERHPLAPNFTVAAGEMGIIASTGPKWGGWESGAPKRIRTSDLCLRRAALYPAELWVQSGRRRLSKGPREGPALIAPPPPPSPPLGAAAPSRRRRNLHRQSPDPPPAPESPPPDSQLPVAPAPPKSPPPPEKGEAVSSLELQVADGIVIARDWDRSANSQSARADARGWPSARRQEQRHHQDDPAIRSSVIMASLHAPLPPACAARAAGGSRRCEASGKPSRPPSGRHRREHDERPDDHSTVTLFARLRGWSTSVPLTTAT